MIDQTITIGNIVEISTIIIGMIVAFSALRSRVVQLTTDVNDVKDDIHALNKVVVEMAVTNGRLTRVEEDIRELRHGRGFIRDAIQGEYGVK